MATVAGSYLRFISRIPGYLRQPRFSVEDAKRSIALEQEQREANFLYSMENAVYGNEHSPYLPLLKMAGCELGDMQREVKTSGLESTLQGLRAAGVYVSFEEFKGRTRVERGDLSYQPAAADFDNPLVKAGPRNTTGGTTGAPMTIHFSIEDIESKVAHRMLGMWGHSLLGAPQAWVSESSNGYKTSLSDARFGQHRERWFAPVVDRNWVSALGFRVVPVAVAAAARSVGVKIPLPQLIGLDESHVIAEWASKRARETGRAMVGANPSHSLRVATAAVERGLDLAGVTFMGAGDPATAGKTRGIEASGARLVGQYTATETGRIGTGCANPVDPSDLHLHEHQLVLITHPRLIPGTQLEVEPFHFTSLRRAAPKILLNVELDDYGVIEERACGCPFEELGWRRHIRDIYSYRKLTGDGVTLIGSTMLRILDEVLPSRFGGTPLDYQLVEEEDEHSFTKLTLVVSPSVDVPDESELVKTVLSELTEDPVAAGARSIWKQADSMRVVRRQPDVTRRGKIVPLARSLTARAADQDPAIIESSP